MKRLFKGFTLTILMIALVSMLFGCNPGDNPGPGPTPDKIVTVSALNDSVNIKENKLSDYDFTKLFTITEDGKAVTVLASYVDSSAVKAVAGDYEVTCTYKTKTAKVSITVEALVYSLELSVESVTLKPSQIDGYKFIDCFNATVDNQKTDITEDMISSDVKNEKGTYHFTVTFHNKVKTLVVTVIDEHTTEVIPAYTVKEIYADELPDFDFTTLFSFYIDGEEIQVTPTMIDTTAIPDAPETGKSYEVVFNYDKDGVSATEVSAIKIVEPETVSVTSKNIVTYPNSEYIDLTTLFEIKKGDVPIPVTLDMISGTVDYSSVGENTITLTYENKEYTAVIEVKMGVIISYAKSDSIIIRKGTNQNTYAFSNDFVVMINGLKFRLIPDSYISAADVNFNAAGVYQAEITVPYSDKTPGLSGAKFEYFKKTITYVVVENDYSAIVKSPVVTLTKGTTEYDVFKNLSVKINGINQTLTENKDWVNAMACYAEIRSDAIDFSKTGYQDVEVAVFVNGPDETPVILDYDVYIETSLKISAKEAVIFSGTTFYTKDLFTITDSGESIDVDNKYISGKVDVFTPGVYPVSIEYMGLSAETKVTVLSHDIQGVYATKLTTIPEPKSTSEDDDETEVQPVYPIGDMSIGSDGSIVIDGVSAVMEKAIDQNTIVLRRGSNLYTLHYNPEGIIVLDPDNSIKLPYNNDKRPFIYFDKEKWTIEDKVSISKNSTHVLEASLMGYSIDAFKIKSVDEENEFWYGLKITLAEKSSYDTYYNVNWGKVVFADGFRNVALATSSLSYNGEAYSFTLTKKGVGKVNENTQQKLYANKVFKGVVNGQQAELRADNNEGFSLFVNSQSVFVLGSWDMNNMLNGGVDYDTNTVFLYSTNYNGGIFSYKFIVDTENLTFELLDKDIYFGKYDYDSKYIYLDGYGTGYLGLTQNSLPIQVEYTVNGSDITFEFFNTSPSFQYGKGAKLYIDRLLNIITVKEFSDAGIVGKQFVNQYVSDGAIVKISSFVLGAGQGIDALYSNIEIITKDGVIGNSSKKNYITTKSISFSQPGFYQFSIEASVNGEKIVSYYTLQIIEEKLKDSSGNMNPLVAGYGNGYLNANNSVAIDQYGRIILDCSGIRYTGFIKLAEDNSFTANAYDSGTGVISLSGSLIKNGLLKLVATGSVAFVDYFTAGTVRQTGIDGYVLREFSTLEGKVYVFATSKVGVGEVVIIESLNGVDPSVEGAEFKVTLSDGRVFKFKIAAWGDITEGLKYITE